MTDPITRLNAALEGRFIRVIPDWIEQMKPAVDEANR